MEPLIVIHIFFRILYPLQREGEREEEGKWEHVCALIHMLTYETSSVDVTMAACPWKMLFLSVMTVP